MLRLYRAPFSTNVERVALALAHKRLEIVVPDSVAILRYLEEKWPGRPLFPSDRARRAELDVFLEWFNQVWKVAPNAIEEELERRSPDEPRIEEMSGTTSQPPTAPPSRS